MLPHISSTCPPVEAQSVKKYLFITFFKDVPFSVMLRSGTDEDILALNYAGFVPVVLEGLKQLDRIVSVHRNEVKDRLEELDNITSTFTQDVENTSQEVDARLGGICNQHVEDGIREMDIRLRVGYRTKNLVLRFQCSLEYMLTYAMLTRCLH